MHNAATFGYMIAGVLILTGLERLFWVVARWMALIAYPPPAPTHQSEPPVDTWQYCLAGDHMAHSRDMAWFGGIFLCRKCVYLTSSPDPHHQKESL